MPEAALSDSELIKLRAIITDYDAAKSDRELATNTVLEAINGDAAATKTAVDHSSNGLTATRTRVTKLENRLNLETGETAASLPTIPSSNTFTHSGQTYRVVVPKVKWKGTTYTAAEILESSNSALRAELVTGESKAIVLVP